MILIEHFLAVLAASVITLVLSGGFLIVSNICFVKVFGEGISVSVPQLVRMSSCILPIAVLAYLLLISVIFAIEQRKTIHEILK